MPDSRECIPLFDLGDSLHNASYGYDDVLTNATPTPSTLDVNLTSSEANATFPTFHERSLDVAESIIDRYVLKLLCGFGLVGNILNLIVLSSQSLMRPMEKLEKCANTGLAALAVSDMLFCLLVLMFKTQESAFCVGLKYAASGLPSVFQPTPPYTYYGFDVIYHTYSGALINTFMMSSTWLTVYMALSRYVVVCHPLRARELTGIRTTLAAILTVYLGSIAFNVPRFFQNAIKSVPCQGGWEVYYVVEGYMRSEPYRMWIYTLISFFLCVVVPLCVLVVCNRFLILALKESTAMRRQYTRDSVDRTANSTSLVTRILVIIVLCHIILVAPAETLSFLVSMTKAHGLAYVNFAIALGNVTQAANFSFNFVLYCVINSKFRRTFRDLVCCGLFRWKGHMYSRADREITANSVAEPGQLDKSHYPGQVTEVTDF